MLAKYLFDINFRLIMIIYTIIIELFEFEMGLIILDKFSIFLRNILGLRSFDNMLSYVK